MGLFDKFWIRQDRTQYFLSGVIVSAVTASIIATYWHASDRKFIKIGKTAQEQEKKVMMKEQEFKKIREAEYFTPKLQVGATRYYNLEQSNSLPTIPDLSEEDDAN